MLIAFLLLLIAESIAPGVVTMYLSLTKVLIIIGLTLLLTIYVSRKAQIDFKFELKKNNPALVVILILITAISFNSLLNFQWWQNIIISIATTTIIFLFYEIFLIKEG
jgi:hypothetical protein